MTTSKDPFRVFPPGTRQERNRLRESIQAVGLKNSVVIDENGNVIDGHERREVCEELGIDWKTEATVKIGLTDAEKRALAVTLNLWRKSNKVTGEAIDTYLIAHPEMSQPQVAALFDVNQSTVSRRKKKLMHEHKLPTVSATIGRDGVKRRVGQRKQATFVVKNSKEFDDLAPDIVEVADELSGLVRQPGGIQKKASRKKQLAEVKPVRNLPADITIDCCDFRNFVPPQCDLILTDPLWAGGSVEQIQQLADFAATWLKADGLLVSLYGRVFLSNFFLAVADKLAHNGFIVLDLERPQWAVTTHTIESWRPLLIFGKSKRKVGFPDRIQTAFWDKPYHDYQQSLPLAVDLVKLFSKDGDVICDPFLGTGTNAIAAKVVGNRQFYGCDIDPEMVKIARHRVATETSESSCSA